MAAYIVGIRWVVEAIMSRPVSAVEYEGAGDPYVGAGAVPPCAVGEINFATAICR